MSLSTLTTQTNKLGTFFALNDQTILRGYGGLKSDVPAFKNAMDVGVKLFDAALTNKNNPILGEAIIGRDVKNLVLSSKIPGSKLDINDLEGSTVRCFEEIAKDLGVKEIDILYFHGPDCLLKGALDGMVRLKEEGKIKHIGLSNISANELKAIVGAGYPISVVENEFNPYYWEKDVLDFCHEKKIVVAGYRPFGDNIRDGELFKNDTLKTIAANVKSSVHAVILQWMNQHGVTSLPHSNSKEHILANHSMPEWTLTSQEMDLIDHIIEVAPQAVYGTSTSTWKKFIVKPLHEISVKWINELNARNSKI